jgi:hypothetical protein
MDVISTIGRFDGELRASAPGSIDIDIVAHQSGELHGEVVISYEDENMNQMEVSMPFTIFIQEPFIPELPAPPVWEDPAADEGGVTPLTIALSTVGGIMIAVPVGLYTARRVKAKESEEFDDDF